MARIPNPGSRAAIKAGCNCPIMDNNHGKFLPSNLGWWIRRDCPLHGTGEQDEADEA